MGIQYDVWDIDDCSLVADLETRRRLIRYIRAFAPDVIITHRPNDYMADHRAAAQLVQDASYMLIVPHECPDAPAMRKTPVIMYNEDHFHQPDFRPDIVTAIDEEVEIKMQIAHLNVSQVYEWLPYTKGEEVPEGEAARYEWLSGIQITDVTTDADILAAPRGYRVRYAKTAARFRDRLIELYGPEKGAKVRYAEAFEVCEYGSPMSAEVKALFE